MQAELSTRALQAGPLKTAFRDLALSIEWHDLRTLQLPGTDWDVIIGHKRREDPLRAVVPLPLHTTALKPSSLKSIFASLDSLTYEDLPEPSPPLAPSVQELQQQIEAHRTGNRTAAEGETPIDTAAAQPSSAPEGETNTTIAKEMVYMAIVASDSTVVYYKLSKGIKKPADIPDE